MKNRYMVILFFAGFLITLIVLSFGCKKKQDNCYVCTMSSTQVQNQKFYPCTDRIDTVQYVDQFGNQMQGTCEPD